jgi:hypothetical protein
VTPIDKLREALNKVERADWAQHFDGYITEARAALDELSALLESFRVAIRERERETLEAAQQLDEANAQLSAQPKAHEWFAQLYARIPEDWRDQFEERVHELADDPHYRGNASGVAAGEVSDGANAGLLAALKVLDSPSSGFDRARALGAIRGYAARRSTEVAELKQKLSEMTQRAINAEVGQEDANGIIDELRAEVAELKRELEDLKTSRYREVGLLRQAVEAKDRELEEKHRKLVSRREENDTLRQELEAEKAAHQEAARAWAGAHSRAAQNARAVPSVLDLAKAIRAGYFGDGRWDMASTFERSDWINAAKASIQLFASPPASPDNTPPVPLPEVLPAGTRTHEDNGLVFASEAKLTMEWGNRPHYRAMHPDGWYGLFEASDIDWAHWRSQQNQDSGSPGSSGADGHTNSAQPGDASLSDEQWLRQQLEGMTTARPIGFRYEHEDESWIASAPGVEPLVFRGTVRLRSDRALREILERSGWPMRRNCTPVDPSTDRARLEAEGWCFDFPPEGELGEEHELLLDEISSCAGDPKTGWKYLGEDHGFYEWRHPTRPGRLPAMGDAGCSVLAWRRAKPIAPSPDAGIEAVQAEVAALSRRVSELYEASVDALKDAENGLGGAIDVLGKRLDELELQGRVTRRFVELLSGYVPRGPHMGLELARIEREERERAGKANA